MGKRVNLLFIIVLCLAALAVLKQGGEQDNTPAEQAISATVPPGRLVVAQAYPVRTLDPAKAEDTGSLRVITNVYEGLVKFKPGTARVEPCLARSWEASGDGLVWTFHLRRGIRFHDGTPLDARAVEQSVKRQMAGQSKSTTYADFVFGPVEKVEAVDDLTIKFHLCYPYAPFLNNLAVPMAAPVVGRADESSGSSTPPPGTGPFIPAGDAGGNEVLLRANRDYWRGAPGVREVAFVHVDSAAERAKLLLNGRAGIALDLAFEDAAELRFRGFPVYRTTGLDICYLGFYTDRHPFDRPVVREAVARSLDRKEIFQHLGMQRVQPAAGHLPPGVTGHVAGVVDASPGKAARLLQEAGYQNGFSFTLVTFTDPRPYAPGGGEELAAALARSASRAGITVNVRAYPWERFKQALREREGDAFLYGWISDNGDPDNFLYTLLSPDQIENGQNLTHYNSAQLETLLISGRNTTDEETRQELYIRAQEVLDRDIPWVVLGHSLHHAATASGVSGFVLSPTGWHGLDGVSLKN